MPLLGSGDTDKSFAWGVVGGFFQGLGTIPQIFSPFFVRFGVQTAGNVFFAKTAHAKYHPCNNISLAVMKTGMWFTEGG